MQQPYSSPDSIIQAASLTPAFQGAYMSAPRTVRVGDKVFERDAARNASERVWYLAAVAMVNPRAVYVVGNQGAAEMAHAYDESAVTNDPKVVAAREAVAAAQTKVDSAEKDARDARGARDKAKREAAAVQKQISAGESEIVDLEARIADAGRIKDFGDLVGAVVTSGGSKLAPWADLQVRLGSMKNHVAQLRGDLAKLANVPETETELKAAEARLLEAKQQFKAAEGAITAAENEARKRLRGAEERVRQEEARKRSQDAADQATQDARDRQKASEDAWNAYYASGGGDESYGDAGAGGGGEEYVEPDWNQQDWATTDPDAELSEPDYYEGDTLEEQADIWGDEDEALKMAALTGEPIIGVNTRVSPYAVELYYEGWDLESDEVFGNDTMALVGGIVAGILTMAPAIINAVAPPPSKDSTGADTNAGSKLIEPGGQGSSALPPATSSGSPIDDFLVKIGLKKTLTDVAGAAGASAGSQGAKEAKSGIDQYLGAAAVIGLAVFVATR